MTSVPTANPLAFLNNFIPNNAFKVATATIAGASAAFLLISALYLAHLAFQRRHTAPGPPRLPLLGNLHQIPSQLQFLQYAEWAKTHGSIFSLDVPGQHIVVVNTFEAAADLFDRQSNAFNDRPRLVMTHEILCDGVLLSLMNSGRRWRRMRRAIHESYGPGAVGKHQACQTEAVVLAMLRTVANPEMWERNLQVTTASSIASSVYGWQPLDVNSPLVNFVQDFIAYVSETAVPGAFFANTFPIMKYIPASIARWKRDGLEWHKQKTKIFETFYEDIAKRIAKEDSDPQTNFVAKLIAAQDQYCLSRKELAWLPGILFLGGTDTTAITLISCVLAMLHHPDVLHQAQNQLDEVIGRERIPTFEDKDNLPYIQAIVRETLRWRPAVPTGLPHLATKDSWYRGYFIPKGALVIGNIWVMNRDPSIYPDYETFRPERFLDPSGDFKAAPPDTHGMGHMSYGFGKRICPGMHFAEQKLFIAIAVMLWAFDIRPCVDKEGNAMLPAKDEWVDATAVIRPAPFECNFSPRFPGVQEILEIMVTAAT